MMGGGRMNERERKKKISNEDVLWLGFNSKLINNSTNKNSTNTNTRHT